MTANSTLETFGKLFAHPPAELLYEIRQGKLTGALKVKHEQQKLVVYFRGGEIVFGVSNSKAFRFFNLLLKRGRIDTKTIGRFPNFANDMEFSASLVVAGLITKAESNEIFREQVEKIVVSLLALETGDWVFSPLVRVRESLHFLIDEGRLLLEYGRCISHELVLRRLGNLEESFVSGLGDGSKYTLLAHEAFIQKRLAGSPKTISEMLAISTIPNDDLLQVLYALWLAGVLSRSAGPAAFSADMIGKMRTAMLSKVEAAADVQISVRLANGRSDEDQNADAKPEEKLPLIEISVDEYLERVSTAQTHYDVLGLAANSDQRAIKHSYFSLAKLFHPDRYHRESADKLRRIQSAFTSLAHAYETLKEADARDAYNAKMHKEIETRERRRAEGLTQDGSANDRRAEQGLESFETGISMLNDEEFEAAINHLGRAIHYSPQNALFHAYYGKALSSDKKNKHKAESELQTATKLDPKNGKIRMMLVEFLLEMNLQKRAEGELRRFLETTPGDREAQELLARLQAT